MDDLSETTKSPGPGNLEPEVVALMLRAVATTAMKNLDSVKAELSGYEPGQRSTFRSPLDDRKLGIVYRTDPDPVWAVVDREALLDHLGEFEGNWETVLEIDGEMSEVLGVLETHAPHLIKVSKIIPEWVVEAALEASKEAGEAVAPGIKKIKPGGVLTVTPDKKEAGAAFAAMVRAGWLTWEGKHAIEGGAA